MSKAKGKSGTGQGTGKKRWNRWQVSANRIKNAPKPYTSKGVKKEDDTKTTSSRKSDKSEI